MSRSRTAIFSWFLQHLQGKEVSPEQVGDADESPGRQETAETLRVFVNGPLPEDRTLIETCDGADVRWCDGASEGATVHDCA